jgi:drug/metabolite transporter (DMT)-like permease
MAVAFLWALCFPLIALAGSSIPPLHLAALRAALPGALLVGCAAVLGRPVAGARRAWQQLAGVGVFATSLGFLGMFRAGEFVSPGIATVINDSQPLIASIIAWFLLGERMTILGWIGLLVASTGIFAIASPQLAATALPFAIAGYAYIVLGATGVATGYVLMKRVPPTLDPMTAMGWQLLLGSIPLAAGAAAIEQMPPPAAILNLIPILLLLAVVGTALSFAIWFSVLRSHPLGKANAYTFLTSIFGLTIGAVFFRERLGWLQIAGVMLTLLGVHLAQRSASHPAPAAPG